MYKKLDEKSIERILEAGIDAFSSVGPDKANISLIAKKAGVSVGVIYKYFSDKEKFFLECVKYSLNQLDEVLSDISFEKDISRYIEHIVDALINHAEKHANQNALYNEITSGSCRKYSYLLAEQIEKNSSTVYRKIIDYAKANGRLKSNQDSRLLAFYLDNLFMILQFSFCCDYYKKRMEIFLGQELMVDKKAIADSLTAFICKAFEII